jgi:hypothetical protein
MKKQRPKTTHASDTSSFKPKRPTDDVLWSPLEGLLFCAANVAVFAFLLGQGHYAYVAYLFEPVFAIGLLVICGQWAYKIRQKKRSARNQS